MRAVLEIRHTDDVAMDWSKGVYEKIYTHDAIQHMESFYLWLLDLLKPCRGKSLLDIACGIGDLPRLASEKLGLDCCGLDFSFEALRIGSQESQSVGYAVGDGERLPYPDSRFNYITSIGSLEHYIHPHLGVEEMTRVLKPDGRACVLLPNTFGIMGNVWTALRTGRTFDDGRQPIQRYAARFEWQELLEEGGFQIVKTLKYEGVKFRNLQDFYCYSKHPKDLVRVLLGPFVPLNWANYFVYVCKKND